MKQIISVGITGVALLLIASVPGWAYEGEAHDRPTAAKPAAATDDPRMIQKTDQKQAESPVYTCPMHPEVRQDKPGKCPKCGMNLVAEEAADEKKPHHHDAPAGAGSSNQMDSHHH